MAKHRRKAHRKVKHRKVKHARRHVRHGRRKGAHTAQQKKFQRAAKSCWAQLRAGKLPAKGGLGRCMRTNLKRR